MASIDEHVSPTIPRGDNPLAHRFDNPPPKSEGRFPRVAYVLQGGGAVGAYQYGVIKGLLESGYEPDWISATSIGAIQAAIIVGNPKETRLQKLAQFWEMVAPDRGFDYLGTFNSSTDLYNQMSASFALMLGQPHFFYPRWWTGASSKTLTSYYDPAPLRDTLLELIDFDRLNASPIRLSIGAVQVRTGHLIYFNNIHYRIGPDHVMASGALPPGFPAVEIDGEPYWDAGVHSNSPLEVILEAVPPENTLCFLIDCFGGRPFVPTNLNEVEERLQDIAYSTHAQRTILNYLLRQKMRSSMQELGKLLTPTQRKKHADLINIGAPHHCTLVHLNYTARIVKSASKDYNFGKIIVNKRIAVGYKDAITSLERESEWGFLPKDARSRLYESSNKESRLLRKRMQA